MNGISDIFFKTFEPEDSSILNNFKTKGEIMGLMKVEQGLPSIGKDVICFGIDDDGETRVEEGFRSNLDGPEKPYDWANFSYTVLYWAYSPVIVIDEECS